MTETRPLAEQLRFKSARTGDHILDVYLEAAERGDRTLADLLADIFQVDGVRLPGLTRAVNGTALTAAVDTSTTAQATTAFVTNQAADTNPLANGTTAPGTSRRYARADHVHPTDATRAPLASPALTGTPTAPTASAATNSTQLATTAFVKVAVDTSATTAASTYLPLAGGTLTGNLGISRVAPTLLLNKPAGGSSSLLRGQTATANRWVLALGDDTAESGSNAGSNFALNRHDDAGGSLGSALSINRATGEATFSSPVAVAAPTANTHAARRRDVGLQWLASATGWAGGTVYIEFALPADLASFEFHFSQLGPAINTGNQQFGFQLSSDGGATWLTAGTDYASAWNSTFSPGFQAPSTQPFGWLSFFNSPAVGPVLRGTMRLSPAITGSTGSYYSAESNGYTLTPSYDGGTFFGLCGQGVRPNRIRFFFNNSTYATAGQIVMMGVRA